MNPLHHYIDKKDESSALKLLKRKDIDVNLNWSDLPVVHCIKHDTPEVLKGFLKHPELDSKPRV